MIAEVLPGEYEHIKVKFIGCPAVAPTRPADEPMFVVPAKSDMIAIELTLELAATIEKLIKSLDVVEIGVKDCVQIWLPSVLVGAVLSYGTVVVPDEAAIFPVTT